MRPALRLAAAVFLLALARTAQPVPPGAVSKTAEATCEFRAIAAQHPDPRLRNADRYAARLCAATLLPRDYEAARDVIDDNPEAFAAYFYVNARTRYIDQQLQRAARRGVEQVVILGAGFDSRAYRFHGSHPRITFFEVDLPATIRAKEQAVSKLLGAAPGYVRFVPVDFDRQALESELPRAGYDEKRRTLFILEGVTMYVSQAGIGATFDFVAGARRVEASSSSTTSCAASRRATMRACTRRAARRRASRVSASRSSRAGRLLRRRRSPADTDSPLARTSMQRPWSAAT